MNKDIDIRKQFQSKFNDFEVPLPNDGWDKIEATLRAMEKQKTSRRRIFYSAVAASIALLIGGLFYFEFTKTQQSIGTTIAEHSPITNNAGITPNEPIVVEKTTQEKIATKQPDAKKTGKRDLFVAKTTKATQEKIKAATTTPLATISEADIVSDNITKAETIKKQDTTEQYNQDAIEKLLRDFENAGTGDFLFGEETLTKTKPLMALAINAKGGLLTSQKVVNTPMSLRSASAGKDMSLLFNNNNSRIKNKSADNVSKTMHSQPFSMGILVSMAIIDRVSIETGLVYTHLESKLVNTNLSFRNQQTLHFYYLGIPVNINYEAFRIGNLSAFFSFGGMLEKDIYGKKITIDERYSNDFRSTSELIAPKRLKQKHHQFSINANFGLSYPIYKGLNLYGKIGGSYYFDAKNEYNTIYSEKRIIPDLNVGVRYEFK